MYLRERVVLRKIKRKFEKVCKKYVPNTEQREQKKFSEKVEKHVKKCGKNLKVFGTVEILHPDKVTIGDDCRLNNQVYINARSSVVIGNDVTISYGAKLISTGYDIHCWMKTGEKKHIEDKPISIGNHCWIGADVIILPGIQITGEYVIVAAGAVVTKSIYESRVVVAGNPAKIVKKIDCE